MSAAKRTLVLHVVTVPESFHFLRGQVRYMHDRGYDVRGVSSSGAYQAVFEAGEPVALDTVEMPRRITPLRDLQAVLALTRIMRARRPAIVHAHTPKAGLLGTIAARLARVPVRIYHVRGLPYLSAVGWRRRLLERTERVACAQAHRVLCVSHSVRRVLVDASICPPDKIVTLLGGSGNGVDAVGLFAPRADDAGRRDTLRSGWGIEPTAPVVAFVGRLVRDKGVVELARAWRLIRDRVPRARLVLAGGDEAHDPLPDATRRALDDDSSVVKLGPVTDVRSVYLASDVVVLPTYREGFPNVLLEAAAMARPVVATAVPGCVDAVLDGITGVLVPAADASALVDPVVTYLCDADLRDRVGARARARVLAEFDRTRLWAALEAEYRAQLAAADRRSRSGRLWNRSAADAA